MTTRTIVIGKGDLRAEVVPSLGAGLARFDFAGTPVFRPWPPGGSGDPFALACNLLMPWSNRISGGGFHADGIFHRLEPNLPGERYPIHGNAFHSEWAVGATAPDSVTLNLESDGPGPYRYAGEVSYTATELSLTIGLRIVNQASLTLPYGLGLHPWLPRTAGTLLQAPAAAVCLETHDHLPDGFEPLSRHPNWDFSQPSPLPGEWINNLLAGWPGQARIVWPDNAMELRIEASTPLEFYLIYSPSGDSGFFCFEPVSHVVDAHNCAPSAPWNGLRQLGPGESMQARATFSVART
ncbi:aldose 1-epimerase [Mesorhizobium sp. KR9-304]|uniref:aldose 1-epimerase n=1 Tax=Mesorhizobium sp. KR9-304 TaxID=3156614 RepID=UPI0032B52802